MAEAFVSGALAHREDLDLQDGLAIELSVVSGLGMIDLRGDPADKKFSDGAKAALGVALPTAPRTSSSKGDITVLWFSVDQWLVLLPLEKCGKTLGTLHKKLQGTFSFACDVSDARTVIRARGDGVKEILMKGTSTDLLAPEIGVGTVRRMLFAEIAAAFHIVDDKPDTIDLYIFRSYADYAWEWLLATARSGAALKLYGPQTPPQI